jgi:glucose/arabinose dehydrogenase
MRSLKRFAHFRVIGLLALALLSVPSAAIADRAGAERNLSKIRLPQGFTIEVYAEVPGARSMTLDRSGSNLFVGTMDDAVYVVADKDKDRKADSVRTLIDGLKVPNGVAMHQGMLYVAERHRIVRYPASDFNSDLPGDKNGEVIFDKLPDKAHHGWRYLRFGPDNKLYVTVGSPCNICDVKGLEGTIVRMYPDGGKWGVYARGIRHSVGLDFQPKTGVLFFTDNNTDMMGDDVPPGELNAAPRPGMHFGFPYYAGGSDRHPQWANKSPPSKVTMPVVEFQAHVAPLTVHFYTGDMFPKEYRNDAFVAQHGSWNRSTPVGYRVMRIKFDDQGTVIGKEVFADGWLQHGEAWGRPVDLLQLPDGSLLLSDDYQGVIYRISYEGDATRSKQ